jgi:hypothetical protein
MRWFALLVGLLLAAPAAADMYQDGSNAKQPQALNNIGKVGGNHYAPAYGNCTWDATSNVAPCIQAAIAAAAQAGGGTVDLPAGTYGISSTITVTASNVGIRCNHSALKWLGAAGGRMMSVAPLYGDTSKVQLNGTSVRGCEFQGNGAADGLYLASLFGWEINDLKFYGPFNGGNILSFDVVPAINGTTFGSNINIQDGVARGLLVDGRYGTSRGIYLGSHMTPTGNAGNASYFRVEDWTVYGNGPGTTAIYSWGADNVRFGIGRVFNAGGIAVDLEIATQTVLTTTANTNSSTSLTNLASTTNLVAGQSITGAGIPNGTTITGIAGTTVTLSKAATATATGVSVTARSMFGSGDNVFEHIAAWSGSLIARGQTTHPSCTSPAAPLNPSWCTFGNKFLQLDIGNGTPLPTVEPGADLQFSASTGFNVGTGLIGGGLQVPAFWGAGSLGLRNNCYNAAVANARNTIGYLCPGDGEFFHFDSLEGDRLTWQLGGGPAGNYDLLLLQPAGTGKFFIQPKVQANGGLIVNIPTSCSGQPAGTLWNNAGVVNICP